METNNDIYKKINQKYSDEEIVEGFVFNETLSPTEQQQVNEEFLSIRLERLKNMTAHDLLVSNLIQMKLLIQQYLKENKYNDNYSFANQLKKYIKISQRSNKEIANNLDIHPTKLSRILNGKENPNVELMYRLEKHSDGELPAHYWWQLYSKELENHIKTDLQRKLDEASRVKRTLQIRA